MRRRRAGRALSAADAGPDSLAGPAPHRSLRVDERHEIRRAGRPGYRGGRARRAAGRIDPGRRPRRNRRQKGRRLFLARAAGSGTGRSRRHDRARARSVLSADPFRHRVIRQDKAAPLSLLYPAAVRTRAKPLLALGLDDKLPHFRIELARLDEAVDRVVAVTRKNYPALDVPFHSRWRHFTPFGNDLYQILSEDFTGDHAVRARAAFDLAIVSVLLDAGAGSQWRYRDPVTGGEFSRSEGLAIASFAMFVAGEFSSTMSVAHDRMDSFRADGTALSQLSRSEEH